MLMLVSRSHRCSSTITSAAWRKRDNTEGLEAAVGSDWFPLVEGILVEFSGGLGVDFEKEEARSGLALEIDSLDAASVASGRLDLEID